MCPSGVPRLVIYGTCKYHDPPPKHTTVDDNTVSLKDVIEPIILHVIHRFEGISGAKSLFCLM